MIFATLALGGVFVHEALHLVVGWLTNARPCRFSLWPHKVSPGCYILGSVVFSNLTWYNALWAALAPLLAVPAVLACAWYRLDAGGDLSPVLDPTIWFGLGTVLVSAWPSSADWRLATRSWPLIPIAWLLWRFRLDLAEIWTALSPGLAVWGSLIREAAAIATNLVH